MTGAADKAGRLAEAIPARKGFYDVVAHGSGDTISAVGATGKVHSIEARVLARYLQRYTTYEGGPIRLLSCKTGMYHNGFAAQLSETLGVDVMAPNSVLWAPSGIVSGATYIGGRRVPIMPPTGEFVTFP